MKEETERSRSKALFGLKNRFEWIVCGW